MNERLVLVHTVPTLVDTFAKLATETLGDSTEVIHVVDETLLKDTIAAGALSPAVSRRVATQVFGAEDAGASAILVTCSSIGAAVEAARPFCAVPLLRVDEPMIDRALDGASVIGVVGTLLTTLDPTTDLIRRCAAARGKPVEIVARLCGGAFDALRAGDVDEHDRRVREALRELVARCEVIVLAQASMARVADQLDAAERGSVEILSSPRSGLEQAAEVLRESRRASLR